MFTGEKIRLAELSRQDLDTYARWFRDYEVQRNLGQDVVPVTDEVEADWYEKTVHQKDAYHFCIRTLAADRPIGICSLADIRWRSRYSTFGIVIGEKDCWGQGYGSEAAELILRFAFDELNLHRVRLWVFGYNERAIRAYEKVGFVHEGTARKNLYREGAYHDVHMMGIIDEEWRALQAERAAHDQPPGST